MYRIIKLALFITIFSTSILVRADVQRDQNERALKPYLVPRAITSLEWDLLQFNLNRQSPGFDSYNYVTSSPVIFDSKSMALKTLFHVKDKRDYNDMVSFFKLARAERESILQGSIDELIKLLEITFPEIKNIRYLVHAEFLFYSSGGGATIVAKYESGVLSIKE